MRSNNLNYHLQKVTSLKLLLLTFAFVLLAIPIDAQMKAINKTAIKSQLVKRINKLRQDVGVAPLVVDKRLAKAAETHSYFMFKNNKLTHSQNNAKFDTPAKRIEHFNPIQFSAFGENILLSKPINTPLTKGTSETLANEMFEAWKDSPGHYANMIEIEFDVCNFGFKLTSRKQVYATTVFAKKGIKIPNQLSNNNFDLKSTLEGVCLNFLDNGLNILANIGNAFSIVGNEVHLYYHDKEHFLKIFSETNDGIAIDVVDNEQFSCTGPNNLDVSSIYDGVLLKPVFRDELIANNSAKSDYRIISRLGTIPERFLNKDFSLVIILIKNGTVCRRIIPKYVPSAPYPLKKLPLKIQNVQNKKLLKTNKVSSFTVNFPFESNETTPSSFPQLPLNQEKILAVEIKSYSSIEGKKINNKKLHAARAKSIKHFLSKSIQVDQGNYKIDSKENWEEFYFQLKLQFADSLLTNSQDELRIMATAKSPRNLPWDSLLYDQRRSTATIYFEPLSNESETIYDIYYDNIRYGIVIKDIDLVKKSLYGLFHNKKAFSDDLFEESIFDFIINQVDLVQNTAAVLCNYHHHNLEQSIRFLNKWIVSFDELNDDAKFNVLNLYSMVNYELLEVWDLPSKRLANVIDPKYLTKKNTELYSQELILNLNLTFIRYFGQVNDSKNISKSFNFISDYFSERILAIPDAVALCKFYNNWSRFDLTSNYLLSRFEDYKNNDEAIFLLLETFHYHSSGKNFSEFEKVHKTALQLDKNRWCTWINSEIQLVRERKVKNLYCKECNEH